MLTGRLCCRVNTSVSSHQHHINDTTKYINLNVLSELWVTTDFGIVRIHDSCMICWIDFGIDPMIPTHYIPTLLTQTYEGLSQILGLRAQRPSLEDRVHVRVILQLQQEFTLAEPLPCQEEFRIQDDQEARYAMVHDRHCIYASIE